MDTPEDVIERDLAAWLPYIRRHQHNAAWVTQYLDLLYSLIYEHTKPDRIHLAVAATDLLAPYIRQLPKRGHWQALLMQQLCILLPKVDAELEQRIQYHVGQLDLIGNKPHLAGKAFDRALKSAISDDQFLEAAFGRIKSSILQADRLSDAVYVRLKEYNHLNTNVHIRHEIYDMAAQYHLSRGEGVEALGYAQAALSYYWRYGHGLEGDDARVGRMLTLMGGIARVLYEFDMSSRYLTLAENYLIELSSNRELMGVYFEAANLAYAVGDYELAVRRYRDVLSYFESESYGAFVARAYHGLGLAGIELLNETEASEALDQASRFYSQQRNEQGMIEVEYAKGYLLLHVGKHEEALVELNRTLQRLADLPDTTWVHSVKRNILADIRSVHSQRRSSGIDDRRINP